MKRKSIIAAIAILISFIGCNAQNKNEEADFPELKGPYLGQKPPGMTPEIFAPGIISTENNLHSSPVFSKGGRFVFWKVMMSGDDDGIYYMEMKGNRWCKPRKAFFIDKGTDIYNDVPFFSPVDETLYFLSDRPYSNNNKERRLWYTNNNNDIWETPKLFEDIVPGNISLHWQFTISNSGNFFLTGTSDIGIGMYDIFIAKEIGDEYIIELLPKPINSKNSDICPFISPDESYLIFASSDRNDGYGKCDIYICYKKADSLYTNPINMGAEINSSGQEWCPIVSLDGKYLFFTSKRNGFQSAYWVDAKIIEELKPKNLK